MQGLQPILTPLKDYLCDSFLDRFEDFQALFIASSLAQAPPRTLPRDHYQYILYPEHQLSRPNKWPKVDMSRMAAAIMESAEPQKLMHLGLARGKGPEEDEGGEVERMIRRERGVVKELTTCQEYHMLVKVSDMLVVMTCEDSINGW
jgi:hypothetical protein